MHVGLLNVSSSQITLSSMNHIACFNATFPVDNEVCDGDLGRSFVLQLTWTPDDQYTVNIHQQNLTVFIDDGKAIYYIFTPFNFHSHIFFTKQLKTVFHLATLQLSLCQ